LSVVIDSATLIASAFAGFVGYFGTSAVIKFPKKVFYGGMIISGLGIIATAACIIYSITVDISGPIMIGATLIQAFRHGDTLAIGTSAAVAVVIALATGMWKR